MGLDTVNKYFERFKGYGAIMERDEKRVRFIKFKSKR